MALMIDDRLFEGTDAEPDGMSYRGRSMSDASGDSQVKIEIPLLGSARESGWTSESVWAESVGDGLYRVWNIPFFAYNIEITDIVECRLEPGRLPQVVRVAEKGESYCVRLYFAPGVTDDEIEAALEIIESRRPSIEKGDRRLWAVAFRSLEDYEWIGSALSEYTRSGVLTIESAVQPDEPWFQESD